LNPKPLVRDQNGKMESFSEAFRDAVNLFKRVLKRSIRGRPANRRSAESRRRAGVTDGGAGSLGPGSESLSPACNSELHIGKSGPGPG